MEWDRKGFTISDDRDRACLDVVTDLLAGTYWGFRRPMEVVERLIQGSLCFSLFHHEEQIGFARVVTDSEVFSWLSDMVIREKYRGRGLGKWLLGSILAHPAISGTQFVLQTRDAHEFYEGFGFRSSERLMTRKPPNP